MITREGPRLAPAVAAARALSARGPAWLCSPGRASLAVRPRWHFVACDPVETCAGDDPGAIERSWKRGRARWGATAVEGLPIGIGYLSYELGAAWAGVLRAASTGADAWPGFAFRFYDALWVHDAESGRCHVHAADEPAAARLAARLSRPAPEEGEAPEAQGVALLSALRPAEADGAYVDAVVRVKAYLRAGDVYQVNLARRLIARTYAQGGRPPGLAVARRLAQDAPAAHALWLGPDESGRELVGNSPERFLAIDGAGLVETCPIKGTRPRARGDADDAYARALAGAPKDGAEHVMIVDLERNDLGRVCEIGSVHVAERQRIVSLPTVHHMVSVVRGRVRRGVGLAEILRATFPGGSITGAPKRRAMQIISELEPAARGPYTGATGWLGAAGDVDLAVAIRTATLHNGQLDLWVGGGIVIDSVPEQEFAETETKAAAFMRLCKTAKLPDARAQSGS